MRITSLETNPASTMPNRGRNPRQKFQDSLSLPFEQNLLTPGMSTNSGTRAGELSPSLYPIVTLWAWMSQFLDKSPATPSLLVIYWIGESGQLCRLRTLALRHEYEAKIALE